jgi:hypothetical protein
MPKDELDQPLDQLPSTICAAIWRRIRDLGFEKPRISAVVYDSRDGVEAEDYRSDLYRIFRDHGDPLIMQSTALI